MDVGASDYFSAEVPCYVSLLAYAAFQVHIRVELRSIATQTSGASGACLSHLSASSNIRTVSPNYDSH